MSCNDRPAMRGALEHGAYRTHVSCAAACVGIPSPTCCTKARVPSSLWRRKRKRGCTGVRTRRLHLRKAVYTCIHGGMSGESFTRNRRGTSAYGRHRGANPDRMLTTTSSWTHINASSRRTCSSVARPSVGNGSGPSVATSTEKRSTGSGLDSSTLNVPSVRTRAPTGPPGAKRS